ncbi:phosphatidylglycerophosphatase A [Campylobacterota bacterium]|nr:phosphatidylglycerophosphatase A [Campylobacterota bacterium]
MIKTQMIKCFVTLFYSGLSPKASGTIGSIVSIPIALALLFFIPIETFWLLTALIFVMGVKLTDQYIAEVGRDDPKEVVIDELVGMWVALALLPDFFSWYQVLIAFIFFRLFDIAKPSLIGVIDRKMHNGLGVMLDDLLAGFIAAIAANLCIKIIDYIGAWLWN